MRALISLEKQKFVIILIAALAAALGFQAASFSLSQNEVRSFLAISLYVYLFLVFWQMFIFDLHLKTTRTSADLARTVAEGIKARWDYLRHKHHWLEFQNYLILPGIIYWMTVMMLYLNPFSTLTKQVFILLSSLGLAISFWYLKTVFLSHRDAPHSARQMIFLTKLYASYLAFAAMFGLSRYFGPVPEAIKYAGYFTLGSPWFVFLVSSVSLLLLYQALFQHHHVEFRLMKYVFASVLFLGALAYFIYEFWNVNYYSGALVLTAFYNTIWGMIHHRYIDRNLTRTIMYEYLAVLFVVLVIVISTTNFAERI